MKTRKSICWAMILIVAILVLPALGASAKEKDSSAIPKTETLSKLSKLHIPFIPNQGQVDERVKYYARTFGGTVFVTETGEIFYSLPKREGEEKTLRGWVLKEELLGGSIKGIKAEEEVPTRVSYFIGNDASKWRSDISTYGTVSFGEVYEGIEVKVKAYGKSVEKLFYVRVGVDPGVIRLKLSGAESLGVNGEGELEVRTELGEVKFSRPVAYQEVEGKRRYVEVSYQVEGNEYGFRLGDYDRGRELVIDPLLQSTYLGGSGGDEAYSIAIDSEGNVYVAGGTSSTKFPGTAGGFQLSNGGYDDAFVAKLDPTLTALAQSTYLGGSGNDYANSIAIDSEGNIYVAGWTWSTDLPDTAGGAQPSNGGFMDGFVTKLNPTLTTLLQSTYLGGSSSEEANSVAIDSDGNVYVAGWTWSTDLPDTAGGAQPSNGGFMDGFVTKLNPTLTAIVQSTYLGGSGTDEAPVEEAFSIAIGSDGNVYVAGSTSSTDFPGTDGGGQPSFGGMYSDGFVAKLNPTLTAIVQSTYLGGSSSDEAYSIAIDSEGSIYVAGWTSSTNLPGRAGGAQPSLGGAYDAFVSKLNSTLTTIARSTYLGGSVFEQANSIAIDSDGNIYVVGWTSSTNFPGRAGSVQPSNGGFEDGFVTKLNATLTAIVRSTYLGGSGNDYANSIAIGSDGTIYVAGYTDSTNFPGTAGGPQPSFGGGTYDAFVARLYSSLTELPGAATLISPSGTVDTKTPTYTWNAVAMATEYCLKVNDPTGNKILQWYSASEANCASGEPICSVTPPTTLAAGPGKWWIRTRNSTGTGPLSSAMSFTVEAVSAPSIPAGPRIVEINTPLTYYYFVRGSTSNADDPIEYLFNWGDGTNSGWRGGVGVLIAEHSWASAGTYLVTAQARCAIHHSVVSSWSRPLSVTVENTISTPTPPIGVTSGTAGVSYVYSTGGSTSEPGHSIQYLFDWGDGTYSGWLPVGKTSASKSWALPGNYSVRAKARCSTHNLAISDWSASLGVSIDKLTVITPNGGEVIPSGRPYTIQWTAPSQEKVKYKILHSTDNGTTWKLIASDVIGTSYNWDPVPVPSSNKTGCYVKVTGYNISSVKVGEDKSDKPFTIGVVRLHTPNAPFVGEVLRSGLPYLIQWEINGTKSDVTKVNLYYSTNGGASYALIESIPKTDPGTRPWVDSYVWTVPVPASNRANCYVKVVAYSGSTVVGSDRSAKPFAIDGVRLHTPNAPFVGEVLRSGLPYLIQWEINGTKSDVTKVNLYYSIDGGASYALVESIPKTDPGTRPWVDSYVWTVPVPASNRANCYVKVVAYSGSTVVGSDRTEKPFKIAGVNLIQPNGGEVLESGSSNPIQWEIYGTKSDVTKVNLYYSIDGGASYALIESIPKTDPGTRPWVDSYVWTVPVPASNRANCYVKVVAYSGSTVVGADTSDKPFTIEVVRLLTPNGGEVFWSGNKYDIWWWKNMTKYPVTATVRVYYSVDGGATWGLITTLDGKFLGCPWIPLVQTRKTRCKVKVAITDTKGVTSSDMSDGYFTVQP